MRITSILLPTMHCRFYNCIILLIFILFWTNARAEEPVFSDWGRTPADWRSACWAVAELGTAPAPALKNRREAEGYAAYLKAKYLTAEGMPAAEGAPEVVVPLLIQAIDAFPDLPETVLALAAYRNGRNEGKQLVQDLAPLAERHPDSIKLLQNYAAALMDENELERTEEVLKRLVELAPHDGLTLLLKGNCLLVQERWEELPTVVQAIDQLPEREYSVDHAILQIRYCWKRNDIAQARHYAQRIVELPETYSHVRFVHLVPPLLRPLNAWELLRRFAAAFINLNAEKVDAATLTRLCRTRMEADFHTQNYEDLAVCLERLLKVPDLPYEVLANFTDILNDAPLRDPEMDLDPEQIFAIAARAQEARMLRRPQDLEPRRSLVLLYFMLKAPQKALAIQQTIPNLDANDQVFRARILASMKRYDEALAILAQFENSRRFRNSADYFLLYGCMAEENGETERSIKLLRKGLKQFPQDASLANSLGYILADHHLEMETAKALIEQAIQAEPENPAYLDSLAWVHYRQGDLGKALEYMAKCLQVMNLPAHDLDQEIRNHLETILKSAGYTTLASFFEPQEE